MSDKQFYPNNEIRRFQGVAIVSDAGNHCYVVAGNPDNLTPELAKVILLGVLKEDGFPAFVKEIETLPTQGKWAFYNIEVEIT